MRILSALLLYPVFLTVSLPAQTRPGVTGSFGNVVLPGGAPGRGVQRSFGNVVFPGTGGPRAGVSSSITDTSFGARLGANVGGRNVLRESGGRGGAGRGSFVYALPVYIGGSYYDPPQPVQTSPNVIVIYPPQPAPVIVNQYGYDNGRVASYTSDAPLPDTVSVYQAPVRSPAENPVGRSMNEQPSGYLIAFKDRTVYSAVAYWVEGDTLHYFTSGNVHNQVSVALVDRDLTKRLNQDRGTEVRLP